MRSGRVGMRSGRVWMRSGRVWMRSSRVGMRSGRVFMRSGRVWMRSGRGWMRSGRLVRASDSQCRSHNCPWFDPSILRHSGIWGSADKAVLNNVHKKIKYKKYPPLNISVLLVCLRNNSMMYKKERIHKQKVFLSDYFCQYGKVAHSSQDINFFIYRRPTLYPL